MNNSEWTIFKAISFQVKVLFFSTNKKASNVLILLFLVVEIYFWGTLVAWFFHKGWLAWPMRFSPLCLCKKTHHAHQFYQTQRTFWSLSGPSSMQTMCLGPSVIQDTHLSSHNFITQMVKEIIYLAVFPILEKTCLQWFTSGTGSVAKYVKTLPAVPKSHIGAPIEFQLLNFQPSSLLMYLAKYWRLVQVLWPLYPHGLGPCTHEEDSEVVLAPDFGLAQCWPWQPFG